MEGEAEVLEGEIDGDAEEGRGEDDGADLGFESVLVPGVGAEGDAGGVACRGGQGGGLVVVWAGTYPPSRACTPPLQRP